MSAGNNQLKEEMLVIRKPVNRTTQGVDFVIDTFHLSGRDWQRGMGNNSLEVEIQELGKPLEVAVSCDVTGVNHCDCFLSHMDFIIRFVSIDQQSVVKSKQLKFSSASYLS